MVRHVFAAICAVLVGSAMIAHGEVVDVEVTVNGSVSDDVRSQLVTRITNEVRRTVKYLETAQGPASPTIKLKVTYSATGGVNAIKRQVSSGDVVRTSNLNPIPERIGKAGVERRYVAAVSLSGNYQFIAMQKDGDNFRTVKSWSWRSPRSQAELPLDSNIQVLANGDKNGPGLQDQKAVAQAKYESWMIARVAGDSPQIDNIWFPVTSVRAGGIKGGTLRVTARVTNATSMAVEDVTVTMSVKANWTSRRTNGETRESTDEESSTVLGTATVKTGALAPGETKEVEADIAIKGNGPKVGDSYVTGFGSSNGRKWESTVTVVSAPKPSYEGVVQAVQWSE